MPPSSAAATTAGRTRGVEQPRRRARPPRRSTRARRASSGCAAGARFPNEGGYGAPSDVSVARRRYSPDATTASATAAREPRQPLARRRRPSPRAAAPARTALTCARRAPRRAILAGSCVPPALAAGLLAATGCGSLPETELPPAAEPASSPAMSRRPAGRAVVRSASKPEGVAADPVTGLAAVALRDPARLALVDVATGAVRRRVALPGAARHLQLAAPGGPVLVPAEPRTSSPVSRLPAGTVSTAPTGRQPHDAARAGGPRLRGRRARREPERRSRARAGSRGSTPRSSPAASRRATAARRSRSSPSARRELELFDARTPAPHRRRARRHRPDARRLRRRRPPLRRRHEGGRAARVPHRPGAAPHAPLPARRLPVRHRLRPRASGGSG